MLGLSLSQAVNISIPGLTTNYSRSRNTILESILNSRLNTPFPPPCPSCFVFGGPSVWRLLSCEEVCHLLRWLYVVKSIDYVN